MAQEAEKIADLVNYEAQKQKLKIKQVCNFSYSSNSYVSTMDILLTKNKQKECHSFWKAHNFKRNMHLFYEIKFVLC